jgi:hypothetical protein
MKHLGFCLLACALAACGDDTRPASDASAEILVPDTFDAGPDTAADTTSPDTFVPVTKPSLAYAPSMVGSDGAPCVSSCALRLLAGEDLDLAVVYRDSANAPVESARISWSTEAPADLATLNAFSSNTDPQGHAQVRLRSGGLEGSLTVTAAIPSESLSLTFTVTFERPPAPVLVIGFEYLGVLPLADFEVRLFEKRNGLSCASVHPDAPRVSPEVVLGPYAANQQASIADLPNLATEQRWIAQVIGPASASGPTPLAVGCADDILVTAGETATAMVYVLDLPRKFTGTYTTTTRLDTLSGGEGTAIGDIMLTLSELFTAPGTLLVTWACRNATGTLGTVCYWVTDGSGQPNFLGSVIVDAADQALLALFEQAVGAEAQDATELISEMLRDLRLVANTRLLGEPATPRPDFQGAFFAPGEASEEWTFVRFRWRLDPTCKNSATPEDCGWSQIPLNLIYGFNPEAPLEAGVDKNLALHVLPHPVPDLTYGPLINYIIERRILPLVFASGGTEPLDSWDDLIATLFGDRLCLDYDDCCEFFADRLEGSIAATLVGFDGLVTACEFAIPAAAQVLRNQLTNLDGALHLGTLPDAPCPSSDPNSDRVVDGYGLQGPLCDWDLWFPVDGSNFRPDNDWRSARQ